MTKRAFADLPSRQVHYRYHGENGDIPLLMLHASPSSSKQMERMIDALGATRPVFAPDMPGNGDSPALLLESPDIADYAKATFEFMDAMGLETADLYGSHTGACIATEMAIVAPDRVRKVVLDGIALFGDDERVEFTEHYAPKLTPDLDGSHLIKAFGFCRDVNLFWPWYRRDAEHARGGGLPTASRLHQFNLEVLKALETYHLAYWAVFRYRQDERLPLVAQPMLAIAAANDPLFTNSQKFSQVLPKAQLGVMPALGDPDFLPKTVATIAKFLDG